MHIDVAVRLAVEAQPSVQVEALRRVRSDVQFALDQQPKRLLGVTPGRELLQILLTGFTRIRPSTAAAHAASSRLGNLARGRIGAPATTAMTRREG